MASEWPVVALGELIRMRKGVSYKGEYLEKPGPRLLGLGTISLGGGIMLDKAMPYGGPVREHQRAYPGDLLLAIVGITPVGSVIGSPALLPPAAEGEFAFTHHVAKVESLDAGRLDLRYLYYLFRSPAFHAYVWQMQSGSTVPEIKVDDVLALEIPLPPDTEQRAIAHILSTLDDKIELNRRMNETLEAMARALFKSWFVDFDPVRAKAEGRDPGLPKPLADLFPARLVDSELGEIPEGWKVEPLDTVLVLQRGFDLPATERTSGAYPVLAASGPSGTHNEFRVRGPGVTTGRSGVLGKVFFVAEDFWPLNTSLWVKEFRHSRPAYAFHLLRGLDFALFNGGSAVPTLNRNHVHTLPTLLPPMGLIDAFERVASGCLARQRYNDEQATTLARLRDALLPRLISGQLRVPDAARLTSRAI